MANSPLKVDNYILEKKLGEGSYGDVYFCRDERNNKWSVIKLIHKEINGVRDETWRRETFALTALAEVRGISRMYDYGATDIHNYIVMEPLLDDLTNIARRNGIKGFSKSTGFHILWQLVKILQDVHSFGIAHGDIKADNLMISGSNKTFMLSLVDFGLSRSFKDHNGNRTPPIPFPSGCINLIHTPARTANGKPHMEAEDLMQVAYLACICRKLAPWEDIDGHKMTKLKKAFAEKPKKFLGEHQDLKPIIKIIAKQKHGKEPNYKEIMDLLQEMLTSSGGGFAGDSLKAQFVNGAIVLP